MSKERSEMESLARQLYRDHKKVLDLITERDPGSAFGLAVQRLFGGTPQRGKLVRIGNRKFMYSGLEKNLVSFLPARWHEELDKTKGTWPGCEKWWAGYPLITWVEIRPGDDGAKGDLKLNAEVGPISNHKVRKSIIEAIKAVASAQGLKRIQFQAGASDKAQLYSRFLRKNSIAVDDINGADEMERKIVGLIADFEPEFELVAGVIPQLLRVDGAS
ncbi:hypothetical protein G6M04_29870 [Agrobacterium rhizogenes]|uniref:hypothetical protein n=1 Tax=Rhizobium rhizogenes TaxID=359 RepID=UPI001572DE75|nr:hypothetical protein [Rhizobium rhizogenes]NTG51612.1 hypothetical protein [Rhizobium rhizogenes]